MTRKTARVLAAGVLAVAAAAAVGWGAYAYHDFTHWKPPPRGELIESSTSPDGKWLVRLYEVPWGGAAGGVDWWANATPSEGASEPRVIYYDDANQSDGLSPHVNWRSARIVVIDGREIDVVTGRYDFRYDGPRLLKVLLIVGPSWLVLVVGVALATWLWIGVGRRPRVKDAPASEARGG
jgi:hypothetical protein